MRTTTAEQSLWLDDPAPQHAPLDGDHTVDVAVLGGGITGPTAALLLTREGRRVAVIEAEQVGGGVTGNSTAKVSALQSTVYSTIRSRHGRGATADYAAASGAAVERVAALAAEEGIDCDLQRRSAFTFARNASEQRTVEKEAEATQEAGLPTVLTDVIDLPYPVTGAVRLDNQLEFHPVKYVRGLAAAVERAGSLVVEHTRATALHEGTPCRVETTGGTVTADHVVVATHYPVFDRGVYFARLEAQRSYCIAARVRGEPPRGMSIAAGSPKWSIRSYRDLLVVCGQGHPAGARDVGEERYGRLEEYARQHWDVEEVTHRWSAQDPSSYDALPMVGHYTPVSGRVLVASGFMKWGLTTGTWGAAVLTDLIAGRRNEWAERFSPNRVSLRSVPSLARMNAKVGADMIGDRLAPAQALSRDDVPRGEARVVREGTGKSGVYRDDEGAVHAVSLRCTQLGCLLRFNGAERSWDCPCHGSRFDVDGAVLEGPAVRPLERR